MVSRSTWVVLRGQVPVPWSGPLASSTHRHVTWWWAESGAQLCHSSSPGGRARTGPVWAAFQTTLCRTRRRSDASPPPKKKKNPHPFIHPSHHAIHGPKCTQGSQGHRSRSTSVRYTPNNANAASPMRAWYQGRVSGRRGGGGPPPCPARAWLGGARQKRRAHARRMGEGPVSATSTRGWLQHACAPLQRGDTGTPG